jgi:hypothetical protein
MNGWATADCQGRAGESSAGRSRRAGNQGMNGGGKVSKFGRRNLTSLPAPGAQGVATIGRPRRENGETAGTTAGGERTGGAGGAGFSLAQVRMRQRAAAEDREREGNGGEPCGLGTPASPDAVGEKASRRRLAATGAKKPHRVRRSAALPLFLPEVDRGDFAFPEHDVEIGDRIHVGCAEIRTYAGTEVLFPGRCGIGVIALSPQS